MEFRPHDTALRNACAITEIDIVRKNFLVWHITKYLWQRTIILMNRSGFRLGV